MKAIYNLFKKNNIGSVIILIIVCILINIGIIISYKNKGYKEGYNQCLQELKDKYSTPVERIVIDTLYVTRDSIIYKTKYITKIQHDTIEKVYNLDNSGTIDLFYKLVNE